MMGISKHNRVPKAECRWVHSTWAIYALQTNPEQCMPFAHTFDSPPWASQGSKCDHKSPSKWAMEGGESERAWRCCAAGLEGGGATSQGTQANLQKLEKAEFFLWSFQKERSPADTMILAQWDPRRTFDFQNCKIINSVSFQVTWVCGS